MKLEPYAPATFGNWASIYVYGRTRTHVLTISNRVSFIGTKAFTHADFERWYIPRPVSKPTMERILVQMKGYAIKVGLATEAAEVLPKLIKMTKDEINQALAKGKMTESRIALSAAKEMEYEMSTGKAPRKLFGAAAASAEAKAKRLAAEAKVLAGEVTEELKEKEAAGATDVKLGSASKKAAKIDVAETTPRKGKATKIIKEVAAKNEGKKLAEPKGFDPAKLKKDGKWRSASSMFKGLIYEHPDWADEKIFKLVQKEFDLADDRIGYVKWNRGWLKSQGVELQAA